MYRKKVIERVSEEQGYAVVEDTLGNYHILNTLTEQPTEIHMHHEEKYYDSIFLNGTNLVNFPGTFSFHPLYDIVASTNHLSYTVPATKQLLIEYISIVQTREGLSFIGGYRNNQLYFSYPCYRENSFNTNILYHPLETVEIKFKPAAVNTRTGIIIKGILIDI